mgnify:CR=1 FL=1
MSGPSYDDPEVYARQAGFSGEWRDTWWNPGFLAGLRTSLGLHRFTSVLDVGCGAGHWGRTVHALLGPAAHLTGLDHEGAFVRQAGEVAHTRGLKAEYVEGGADALPFADDSFDVTTCQTVLIHVPEAEAVVKEMVRVTRPGGVVLLVEPDNAVMGTSFADTSVPLTPDERLELHRLHTVCLAGKRALGEGDGTIGSRLPALLHQCNTRDVRVVASDKCAWLYPPYDDPHQAVDLKTQLEFATMDMWMPTGTREDSRRHFLAGGGSEAAFERCWRVVVGWLRTFEQQVAERRFHTARPTCMVVAAAQPV